MVLHHQPRIRNHPHQLSLPLIPGQEQVQQCRHHAPVVTATRTTGGDYAHSIHCDDCGENLGRWESADVSHLPIYYKDS